jgi:predicted NBD/HSP70 family sugar kinase
MTLPRYRSTVRDLRRDNRAALLWALFADQPCTRHRLSTVTGLSAASVSTVIRELLSDGIVTEAGPVESDGGRPSVLLRMNPMHGQVIGVDVGETKVSAESFDLTMTRLARADHPLSQVRPGPDLIAGQIAACLDLLIDDTAPVLGVGIGVPGTVYPTPAGTVVHAQSYGWDAVPLEQLLRAHGLGVPLLVDNSANAMGQAERWFGAARGGRRAVACLIGAGIGACLISADGTVAEADLGHVVVEAGGRICRCGSRGCLEAYAGAEAILASCGQQGGDPEAALAGLITAPSAAAAAALDRAAAYLGIGIASLINLVNPDLVIIGGWAGLLLAERQLPAIRDAARAHALRHKFASVTIDRGDLGSDAVALGAASFPIAALLDAARR